MRDKFPEVDLASAIRELAMACADAAKADADNYWASHALRHISDAEESIATAKKILIAMKEKDAA